MSKKIIIILVLVAVVIVGYLALKGGKPATAPTAPVGEQPVAGNVVTVTYANNLFGPAVTKVKVGDTVKFVNSHVAAIRISSNPHPIHTSYPKLDSDRLEPGQSYDFTTTEKVTISYHNHFNPTVGGQIVVE